jgi:hypothetical protein
MSSMSLPRHTGPDFLRIFMDSSGISCSGSGDPAAAAAVAVAVLAAGGGDDPGGGDGGSRGDGGAGTLRGVNQELT